MSRIWLGRRCTGHRQFPASPGSLDTCMKRTWTIIGVRDVPFSFTWYQTLLGEAKSAPGHKEWGQIRDSDGTVLTVIHTAC